MAITKRITPVGRVSFPSVFEASSYQGGEPKYSMILVFDPSKFSPREKKLWAEMKKMADEVSMDKFKKPLDKLPANFKKPFRDGAEKEDLSGFGEGKVFITVSSKMKPGLVDEALNPIMDKEDFYPGCFARATVTAYAYDNVGKGVAFGLQNIQKVADGERLDSRTDADKDFAGEDVDFQPPATPEDDDEDFN